MRKLLYLATCVCLASTLAWRGSSTTTPAPNPDDGKVTDGILTNTYFNLSYPLPQGWTEGIPGPGPSVSGYYVLATFVPTGDFSGTIMVAAQDIFFAAKPLDDLMAMTGEFTRSISLVDGMTIDRPPAEVRIAGRLFSRVDFSGVGLFRSALTTKIRCHFVSFNLTAKSPELLAALLRSLDNLGPAGHKAAGRIDPMCIGNYADAEHLLTKIDPAAVAPSFIPIPVRMVVGSDGSVEHVRVIRATSAQRDSIERALGQWRLRTSSRGTNRTLREAPPRRLQCRTRSASAHGESLPIFVAAREAGSVLCADSMGRAARTLYPSARMYTE